MSWVHVDRDPCIVEIIRLVVYKMTASYVNKANEVRKRTEANNHKERTVYRHISWDVFI